MMKLKLLAVMGVLLLSQVMYEGSTTRVAGSEPVSVQANVPPQIEVIPDVSSGKAPLRVRFECNARDDDGEIAKVEWDFEGDGVFEKANSVKGLKGQEKTSALRDALQGEKTFLKPGIFHILVKVTDDKDSSSVQSVTIQVYSDTPYLDVIPCDREGFAYMARSGYEALFTGWMGDGAVQFQIGEAAISYELKDQTFGKVNKTQGVAEGNKIWYSNVYENVDVRYTVYEDLLLEELIFKAPVSMSVIEQSFTIRNVEYKMEEDGSIGFYNGDSLIFTIPRPVMYELNNPEKKSYGLHYEIVKSENGYVLRKIIDDTNWLQTAAYPVVIDSSTQGEIADPWEQEGLTPYGQYFKNLTEYVDPLTGHLVIRHTDYALSGRGLDVAVTRVYTTLVAYKQKEDGSGEYVPVATYIQAPTDLGCGWSLDFPWLDVNSKEAEKYLHLPNGTQIKTNFINNVWEDHVYGFTMYKNGNNTYTKYRDDGIREDYDNQGRIVLITDLNGNVMTFTYGQIGYSETGPKYGLIQITDTVGRVVNFSYSAGKLMSLSDGVRTTSYNYSGDRLVSVTDPLGRVTTYDYMAGNSFLITGVHYPTGGFSTYEYTSIQPERAKLAPYKSSQTENGVPVYYVYKVDSPDTVTWTSPKDIYSVSSQGGRPCVLQRDDGSLVMYFKDTYVWTEEQCQWVGCPSDCEYVCNTITHTEYWLRRSVSEDQKHWSSPQNMVQVKNTTGNPVVIEKRDGSYVMYYLDTYVWTEQKCEWQGCPRDCEYVCNTITHTEYWIYRRTSSDGIIWSSPVKFLQTSLGVRNIAAIQKNNSTFLLCYTDKVGSSYYIRQITSTDGLTWSTPSNVVQVDSGTGNPALIQKDSGEIYLAYRKGNNYVYAQSNTGQGWSSPVQTTAQATGDPSFLTTVTDLVLIYKGTNEYFYRISSTNGTNWSSPSQIAPQKAYSDPSTVFRKDLFYRVSAQYVSASELDLVKVTEFSYEGEDYLATSSDVIIRDAQTVHSSMHFEYDSKGRPTERVTKDEQGVQTEKIIYAYNDQNKVIGQDVYAGNSQQISYTVTFGYDNWGNTVYMRDPEGAEHFYSYANSTSANQFIDSKGVPVTLFSNAFYTNTIPSNCHTLLLGEAFINSGKVKEVYNKYDAKGNVTETKTLFPTRTYAVFSGVFAEPGQTTFQFDLTGLTVTNGILVITSVQVPTSEIVYETHSEPGKGWHNTGNWNQKSFYADYTKCTGGDCYDGETEIGPFDHYPGSPNYTGYTTWIEDNTQYVKTSYSTIVNEYPEKVEYNLNSGSWTEITSDLGSGTTSVTISADQFVQGVNTLQFRDSNTYSTKLEWTLYLNQGASPQQYVTTYTHDTYGNLTSLTDAEGHTTTYGYSAQYQYAYLTSKTSIVNGQPVTTSATYDFQTGQVTSRICACGSVTNYEYDAVGRLTKVIYPLVSGELTRAEYEIIYNDVSNTVTLFNENDEKTMRYYDGLGRMIKTETYKNAAVWSVWTYEYNYLGKPSKVTDPLSRVYQYEYDSLGRITKLTNPDLTFRTMVYDDTALIMTVKDENYHQKVYTFNWRRNLLSVKEYNGVNYYLTEYQYDEEGNLTQMIDPEQNSTTYVYDSPFGLTDVFYPDLTEQHFTYDNTGNVTERTDQNGNHITYEYDALSRLTSIDYGDTSVAFTYDLAGNRTSMVTPDVTTSYIYNERNRLTQVTTVIDGTSYALHYAYDPAGNVTQVTYPDSTTVQYSYSLSQLVTIQNYASFTYFPDGNLEKILSSNGVTTDFGYDGRGRIQNIHAYTANDLLNLTYSYNGAGNITQIENNFLTAGQEWITSTEVYSYDDLDRLVSTSNGSGTISYTYDSKKRLSVTENGEITSYGYDYDLLLSAGEKGFTYDLNGNTLTKSAESQWVYHYDKANQLTQVDKDGQTFSSYMYDGEGRRVKKTEWSEDLQAYTTIIYIYSGANVLYEKNTTGTSTYIYGPSGKIAKRTFINNETNIFYYTTDHLGSTRLVTDENGTPLTSATYSPFGNHASTGAPESYLFTGKERDATGLYYFMARYYDPETGRFLTRDPYTSLPDDPRVLGTSETCGKWLTTPLQFDRFTYASSNPLRYVDPTGLNMVPPSPPSPPQCVDPECQELLDQNGQNNSPADPDPNDDDSDDNSYKTRDEECRECANGCMKNDPRIKELLNLKKQLYYLGAATRLLYALVCGLAAAAICASTGVGIPVAPLCGVAGATFCGWAIGELISVVIEQIYADINWEMAQRKCACAIYCGDYA